MTDQMTEEKAIPLPVKLVEEECPNSDHIEGPNGEAIALVMGRGPHICERGRKIVAALNSHDSLLAALKEARAFINGTDDGDRYAALAKIDAALEGEKPAEKGDKQ